MGDRWASGILADSARRIAETRDLPLLDGTPQAFGFGLGPAQIARAECRDRNAPAQRQPSLGQSSDPIGSRSGRHPLDRFAKRNRIQLETSLPTGGLGRHQDH